MKHEKNNLSIITNMCFILQHVISFVPLKILSDSERSTLYVGKTFFAICILYDSEKCLMVFFYFNFYNKVSYPNNRKAYNKIMIS